MQTKAIESNLVLWFGLSQVLFDVASKKMMTMQKTKNACFLLWLDAKSVWSNQKNFDDNPRNMHVHLLSDPRSVWSTTNQIDINAEMHVFISNLIQELTASSESSSLVYWLERTKGKNVCQKIDNLVHVLTVIKRRSLKYQRRQT